MWNFDRALARAGVAAGFLTMAAFFGTPSFAACFEDIGCTDSDRYDSYDLQDMTCETLERIADRIYEENESDEDMNRTERHNLRAVAEAESEAGC